MIVLLAALVASVHAPSSSAALSLCKPLLARKAGGEISTVDVASSRSARGETTIRGPLVVFLGGEKPGAGMASPHHLIRAELSYQCRVSKGRVRASVSPKSY